MWDNYDEVSDDDDNIVVMIAIWVDWNAYSAVEAYRPAHKQSARVDKS